MGDEMDALFEDLKKEIVFWQKRAIEAEAENKEIRAVFDLQETRTKKAEKIWQQATGKHGTLPDLGMLLDWLMGEIKQQALEAKDE